MKVRFTPAAIRLWVLFPRLLPGLPMQAAGPPRPRPPTPALPIVPTIPPGPPPLPGPATPPAPLAPAPPVVVPPEPRPPVAVPLAPLAPLVAPPGPAMPPPVIPPWLPRPLTPTLHPTAAHARPTARSKREARIMLILRGKERTDRPAQPALGSRWRPLPFDRRSIASC